MTLPRRAARIWNRFRQGIIGGLVVGLAASPVLAQPAHPLAAPDLEAFLDGLMPTALKTAQTPGAVVVVVKDGQVLFEKGYGYADYARRIPDVYKRQKYHIAEYTK